MPTAEIPSLIMFLTRWDEEVGAKIVDVFPKSNLDFDVLAVNIFQSFQTIFGNDPKLKFDKTPLTLPLKSHRKLAKITLDSMSDNQTRGGWVPIFLTFLLPPEFPENRTNEFASLQESILDAYMQGKSIRLQSFFDDLKRIVENVGVDLKKEADGSFREKDFKNALNRYNQATILMNAAGSKQYRNYLETFNKAKAKRVLELTEYAREWAKKEEIEKPLEFIADAQTITDQIGNSKLQKHLNKMSSEIHHLVADTLIRRGKSTEHITNPETYPLADEYYLKAEQITLKSGDNHLIKFYRQILSETYIRWATFLMDSGKTAIKKSQLSSAHEILSRAVMYAQKSRNTRILNKTQEELNRVPNP